MFELHSPMIDPGCVGRLSYLRTRRFKGEDSLAHTSPFTAFYSTFLTDKGEALGRFGNAWLLNTSKRAVDSR